jgi:hypothetical protein
MVTGETVPIWVPKAEGDEIGHGSSQIPKQEQSKEDTSTPQQQSSSCGPGKSEPAPPLKAQKQPNFWSVVRQEITAVLEHNTPKIDRMSATTVEELEVIRFFENYLKTTLRGKWANQFKDTKIMDNGGFKATQGFIPSAWDTTQEQEREILRTPTVVTSDAHLLATAGIGYMTLSNVNLRIFGANIHNKQWT